MDKEKIRENAIKEIIDFHDEFCYYDLVNAVSEFLQDKDITDIKKQAVEMYQKSNKEQLVMQLNDMIDMCVENDNIAKANEYSYIIEKLIFVK